MLDVGQGVLTGLPIIGVMWYMLKDVRADLSKVKSQLSMLALKVAEDHSSTEIKNIKETFYLEKQESQRLTDDIKVRLSKIEDQLPLIWIKIGDRPDDIRKRNGD